MSYFNIYFFLFLSFVIFFLGLFGLLLSRKNIFLVLISLEILFLAIHLNFAIASLFLDDIFGFTMIIYILAISGSEISIGLAIFILLHRIKNLLFADKLVMVKG